MKFVTQTRTGIPEGNCTEACVASILGCDLAEVPELFDPFGPDYRPAERFHALLEWIMSRGFFWIWGDFEPRPLPAAFGAIYGQPLEGWLQDLDWDGYHLLAGPSPGGVSHCVVAEGGRVVWDPNPSRRGIIHADGIGILAPIAAVPIALHARGGVGLVRR